MGYQMREVPLSLYCVEGRGPMGFAVMGESLGRGTKESTALKAGEIARSTAWVRVRSVGRMIGLDFERLLSKLTLQQESTADLFLLVPDRALDAVGGHLLIGDLWHRGNVRDFAQSAVEIYMPLKWALTLIEEWAHEPATVATP